MLKGNLSTRPFYNDRLVSLGLGLVAVIAIALTVFNVTRISSLSAERARLRGAIAQDRDEAARVSAAAEREQKTVNQVLLGQLAISTREANALIDQRTFSWTSFFGIIEKTLPLDVRLVSVSPRVEKGEFRVEMTVMAKRLEDVETFRTALNDTGEFYNVIPAEQQARDDGTFGAMIDATYRAGSTSSAKAPAPKPGTTPATAPPAPAAPPPSTGKRDGQGTEASR